MDINGSRRERAFGKKEIVFEFSNRDDPRGSWFSIRKPHCLSNLIDAFDPLSDDWRDDFDWDYDHLHQPTSPTSVCKFLNKRALDLIR